MVEKVESLYLELLKKTLTDLIHVDHLMYRPVYGDSWKHKMLRPLNKFLQKYNMVVCKIIRSNTVDRMEGRDWPVYADTMVGIRRLNNLEHCIHEILKEKIEGDFIETGVWRGGACIFMRAILKVNQVQDRNVWLADSFEGLPVPYLAEDKGSHLHSYKELAVSREEVERNFTKYGLLDDQVKFLEGWFSDTLRNAPIQKLSLLRLDGDMYSSTKEALESLYPKLSPGGFCIIDDYGMLKRCKKAVDEFRDRNMIADPLIQIDQYAVYWRKAP